MTRQQAWNIYEAAILLDAYLETLSSDLPRLGFLKTVLAQRGGGYVAGKGNHRHAVHVSGGDARHKVRRARAAGGEHHARAPCGAGVAVGGVGGALLVGRQDMADAVGIFIKFIVEVQHRTARITEQRVDALLAEHLDENLRTGQKHDDFSFPSPLPPAARGRPAGDKKTAFVP